MALSRQTRRRLAHGGNATLVSAVVVGLVVVLYLLVDLQRVRIDLSADQGSVLMEDTRTKLRLLDEGDVATSVTAFSAQEGKKEAWFKNRALRDLMDELDFASNNVKTRFVDFDKDRFTAEELGVTEYGTVVIQRGDDRVELRDREMFRRSGKKEQQSLDFVGEAAIARAFGQLLSDEARVVYSLVGHGELDTEGSDPAGAGDLKKLLDGDGYQLKPLDLVRSREGGAVPRVPDDASAVLVLRPTVGLTAVEEDLLLAYLATGGKLLFAVEPSGVVPGMLGRLGVSVAPGKVLDKLLVFPYPDRPVPKYRSSPITQELSQAQMVTEVAGAAAVQVATLEGVRSTTLLETSRDGWIERGGPMVEGKAAYQPDVDGQGPAQMAISLEVSRESGLVRKGLGQVVVLGDADMVTSGLLSEGPGNATFVLNSIRWLVGDAARLSVVGKPREVRKLLFTDEDRSRIMWAALGTGPLLIVLLGAAVWTARRGSA
jgi:ABC-type uncharacterized transport system